MADVISSFVGNIPVTIDEQYFDGGKHDFDKNCIHCFSTPSKGEPSSQYEGNAMFKWNSLKNRRKYGTL